MSRQEFDAGAVPRQNFIDLLTKDARKYKAAGVREQVMLSFTTDPYNPGDTDRRLTRQTIQVLKQHGLGFCTLTKGGKRALRDLDLFRPDRDAFASTLTALDPAVSLEWESGAALPQDRIDTLEQFHKAGVYTWVSLEPVYDTEATLAIIEATHRFVNLYKVGRINYHRLTKEIDWKEFACRVIELLNRFGARHYVKRDLQPFLPTGYENPRYIPQHN
jgi:DNA repair photolyase